MKLPSAIHRKDGSALVAVLILSLMVMAGIVTSSQWSSMQQRLVTADMGRQYARDLAESGLNESRLKLKAPDFGTFLPIGSTATLSGLNDKGRFDVVLRRTGPDSNLVETTATGYYYNASGPVQDGGKPAFRSVIRVLFRVTNISQYLWALPRNLPINPGTDISAGAVYGGNLQFISGATPSRVYEAYYYNSATVGAGSVVWTNPNPAKQMAIRLPYPPTFPALDQAVRSFYMGKADTGTLPVFSGTVSSPGGAGVYFANHDIDIGVGQPLTVDGVYVIYSTGSIIIHNNILRNNANSWIALLAEGNIEIAGDAPVALTLNGTFMTNQYFRSASTIPTMSPLILNGGVVALLDVENMSARWPTSRTYAYGCSPDPNILLPNFADILDYEVQGMETR